MQPEEERRHDAEVAAAASQRPEEIRVLVGAGGDEAAVREDDIRREQVIDGQPVLAGQVPDAAAERQAADAGAGHGSRRDRQPEGVGGVVHVGPGGAALDARRAGDRVDAHALHAPEVEHEAAVYAGEAGAVVAAAANRELHAVLAGEGDRRDDVGDIGDLHDQGGSLVDHAVVQRASVVIAGGIRLEEVAAYGGFEVGKRGVCLDNAGHGVSLGVVDSER